MAHEPARCEICDTVLDVLRYHIEYSSVSRYVYLCRRDSEPIREVIRATTKRSKNNEPVIKTLDEVRSPTLASLQADGTVRALRRGPRR